MIQKIMNFIKDEDGIETAEYAVMGALVVIVAAGAVTFLGNRIDAVIDAVTAALVLPAAS